MIIAMLPDEKRLHLQHGPIDLIIEAFGGQPEIAAAYRAAAERFETVLDELVTELPTLRTPAPSFPRRRESREEASDSQRYALDSRLRGNDGIGVIAKKMFAAVMPHAPDFITPMAAVAGAVADEILATMTAALSLEKAYVNNGGDIALYLAPHSNQNFQTGIVSNPTTGELVTTATIASDAGIKGIATSGWNGRSHSLGIADSVTVFAKSAAIADAAATIIANHVDVPDCKNITRQPADHLSPDSDLGSRLVTVSVGSLKPDEITRALALGEHKAQTLCQSGLIIAAFICLQGVAKIVHWPIDDQPAFVPHSKTAILQDRISHA